MIEALNVREGARVFRCGCTFVRAWIHWVRYCYITSVENREVNFIGMEVNKKIKKTACFRYSQ